MSRFGENTTSPLESDQKITGAKCLEFLSPNSSSGNCVIADTPRRKLSMSIGSPSPRHNSMDSGFRDSDSHSLLELSLTGLSRGLLSSTVQQFESAQWSSKLSATTSSARSPLGEIQNFPKECARRTLLAKRFRTSQVMASTDKENSTPVQQQLDMQFFKSPTQRPSSLPALLPRGVVFMKQISSPLERMSLVSPSPTGMGGQRHSSVSSFSGSDGYHSEVFEDEEMGVPAMSDNLTSLINGPFDMTNKFTNMGDAVCPTPVRPFAHLNLKGTESAEPQTTREQRKRTSPDPNPEVIKRARKRPPLPFSSNSQDSPPNPKSSVVPLLRSQSVCMPVIEKSPVISSSTSVGNDEKIIGDNSKPYALPLLEGKCMDLKCITPKTVSELLQGKFDDVIAAYTLVDCRYPYEYEGGHIRGAKNIWKQDDLTNAFFSGSLKYPEEESNKREIFIFHCEFSSKRGPKMSRFLREKDRKLNGMAFPKLYYPELYLMEGGYKAFYEDHSDLCEPRGYCCMENENHKEELRNYTGDCSKKRRGSLAAARHRNSVSGSSRTRCMGSNS